MALYLPPDRGGILGIGILLSPRDGSARPAGGRKEQEAEARVISGLSQLFLRRQG